MEAAAQPTLADALPANVPWGKLTGARSEGYQRARGTTTAGEPEMSARGPASRVAATTSDVPTFRQAPSRSHAPMSSHPARPPRARHASCHAALLAIVALSAVAASASAQEAPDLAPTRHHAVSVQPLHVEMGLWSGEFERAIGGPWTASLGAAYLGRRYFDFWQEGEGSDDRAVSTDVGLHLYVDRTPFRGLSLVVRGGVVGEQGDEIDAQGPEAAWRMHPTAGFALDFNWADGRLGRILLGTGIGYRHAFVLDRDRADLDEARDFGGLTLRAAVGYRF
jgi:hypothetical protein